MKPYIPQCPMFKRKRMRCIRCWGAWNEVLQVLGAEDEVQQVLGGRG